MERKSPKIRVGPAGWSYDDWDGIVYPRPKPRGFHAAEYLSQLFSTIEINTSFDHPPAARMTKEWARRVEHSRDFQFTVKLWQRFTHDRDAGRQEEKTFKEGIAPLAAAARALDRAGQLAPMECRIDRAAREVERAAALLAQRLDHRVAVKRALGEDRQQHRVEVALRIVRHE